LQLLEQFLVEGSSNLQYVLSPSVNPNFAVMQLVKACELLEFEMLMELQLVPVIPFAAL